MGYKDSIAMFMICLIIMLPVYSSSVWADISVVRTYDQNGIEGFMQTGGELTVEAYARVTLDDDITPDQVLLESTAFNSCSNPDPDRRFLCKITIPTTGFLLERPSHSYMIKLYTDLDELVDTETAIITFDDLRPVITRFIVPTLVGRGDFDIEYEIRDPTDSENGCTGIGGVNIYLNGATTPFSEIIINKTLCQDSGMITLQGSSLQDGLNVIELVGYDRFGQESLKASVQISAELRSASMGDLMIIDKDTGDEMEWFTTEETDIMLIANFSGPDIVFDSVVADLSDINLDYSSPVPADDCSSSQDVTTCVWDPLEVDLDSSISANIGFTMEDYAGNDISLTKSMQLMIDTTGPTINSIESMYIGDDGIDYAGNFGNFIVTLTENAYLDSEKIQLYIDNFATKATSCEATSLTRWKCYFENIDIGGFESGEYQAYMFNDSTDFFGNPMTNNLSIDFIIDKEPPLIVGNATVRIISGGEAADRPYVQIGDSLEVTINVTEHNVLTNVTGDFHTIVYDADQLPADCTNIQGDEWTCNWQIDEIDIADSRYARVRLNVNDGAGNSDSHEFYVEVFGVEEKETTVWTARTTMSSPDAIDRQMVTFYEPFMWHVVKLTPAEPGIVPIDVSVISCSNYYANDSLDHVAFLSSIPEPYIYTRFGMTPESAYEIYLKSTMIQAYPAKNKTDVLKINCILDITGLKGYTKIESASDDFVAMGGTIVESPPVNVTFDIRYFNNPIGTVSEEVAQEIEDTKESWLVDAEWIGMLDKILNYGKLICSLLVTWNSIVTIWATVKDIFGTTCKTGVGAKACSLSNIQGNIVENQKKVQSKFYDSVQPYCKMLNCQYSKNEKTDASKGLMGIANAVTGNADYTQKLRQSGKDRNAYFGNLNTDPSGSLLLSIMYLCLPGVIYNLQKARAIDCLYINCLKEVDAGMPIQLCTSQRGYAYCKFVFGEIFNLIPFTSAITAIGQNVLKALSHPLEFIGFAFKLSCTVMCKVPTGNFCATCTIVDFMSMMMDVLCDLGIGGEQCETAMWENLDVAEDACEQALEEEEEEEE